MTSSAEYIEKYYTGMKTLQIEAELKKRFPGLYSMSRPVLQRLLRNMKDSGRISTKGTGFYCLPPHFQPDLPEQPELTGDQDDINLPGW